MTLSITFYDNNVYGRMDFINRDADFFGNGVKNPATSQFPITYNGNMTVNIGQGVAWVDGYRIANDSNLVVLTVPAADATNPRIDIIQIGHDDVNHTYSLMVKKGVAAATPTEPGADTNYIKLYAINVAANATSITSANVTDRRALLPLNVNGSQIVQSGSATTGANTFTDVQTAPTFAATSTTAPLQLPVLTQVPSQTAPSGTLCLVNGVWYESNGSAWNPMSVPWSAVTGAPTDYAKTDVAQTWTQPQTWAASQTFAWTAISGKPTTASGYGIAGDSPTWTGTHTFNNAIAGSVTGSAGSVPWSGVTSKPTSVSGFGIAGDSPTWTGTHTFNNVVTAKGFTPSGTTGANATGGQWAGTTTAGAPTAGTWTAGQWVDSLDGKFYKCTASGSPGTWVTVGAVTLPKVVYIPLWNSDTTTTAITNVTSSGGWFLALGATGGTGSNPSARLHTLDQWSNGTQFALEVSSYNTSASNTVYAAIWDFTAGAIVSASQVSNTGQTVATLVRSGQFSLTPGHVYGVTCWSSAGSTYITHANLVAFPG